MLALFLSFAYKGLQNTPDSCSYINAAENLARGRGLVVSMTEFVAKSTYFIYASWPPLYPALLSLPILAGTNKFTAAIIIQVLSITTLLIALFSIAYLIRGTLAAYLSLLLIASMPSFYFIASKAWSEMTFTALSVTAILFLLKYNKNISTSNLLLAGLFTGLAGLTRMNGIAIICAGLIIIFSTHRKLIPSLKAGLIFLALGLTPLVVWLIRIIYLTGHITGVERKASQLGVTEIINYRLKIIYYDFFAPFFNIPNLEIDNIIFAYIIPIGLTLLLLSIFINKNFTKNISKSSYLILAIFLQFITMVSALAMLDLPTFDSRYTFVLYPFIVALLCSSIPQNQTRKYLAILAITLFCFGAGYYSLKFIKVKQNSKSPIGPFAWQSYVNKIPKETTIFSNYHNIIALYSRPAKRTPRKNKLQINAFLTGYHKKGDFVILFPGIRSYLAYEELLPENNKGMYKTIIKGKNFIILKFIK